jgi:3-oxoadipate enol-lactonase
MPTLEVNGVELAYDDHGSGLPLILIHGWGGTRTVWAQQIEAFARNHRVIAVDLPGHGDSGRPAGDHHYSPAACAADIHALADALGIEQAVLLGQSMGTLIAQLYCLAHPARVKALVLNGALAGSPPAGVQAGPWVEAIQKEIESRGMKGYLDQYLRYFFSPGFDPVVIRSATVECYKFAQHAALAYCRAVSVIDIRDRLGEIRVPTLLIVGSEDGRTPVDESEYMNRRIPDSWLRIVKGAGHVANVEKPHEFNRAVLGFLETIA